MHDHRPVILAALFVACASSGGRDEGGASELSADPTATSGGATVPTGDLSSGSTVTETGAGTGLPTGEGTQSGGETTQVGGETTRTSDEPTQSGGSTEDTTGTPVPPPFAPGHVFVVGFNDRLVFEYDATLEPVTSWTHPSFDGVEGPAGMVFDYRGYLVVASYDQFCLFKGPGEIETCHPKIAAQRTENVIFDISRNLFTTTSTGGTDEIHKYDENYNHLTTFNLPTGNLTGITCDPSGDLFVASQAGPSSIVYKVNRTDLSVLDSFEVPGNAEGLQYGSDGDLLVALSGGVGIASVVPKSPSMVLKITADPGLLWPVPLTIDEAGNRYTGDFEDGAGMAASDLFVFAPDGTVVASRQPSELHGPFGLVVAGNALPCGAVIPN